MKWGNQSSDLTSTSRRQRLTSPHLTSQLIWQVPGVHVGLDWQEFVKFDERYLRPTEVDALIGDPTKAGEKLGWVPTIDGKELAKLMVDADVEALERGPEWIDTVKLASWGTADAVAAAG